MIVLALPYPISARFGRLTVLDRAENDRFGRTQWRCRCDCGREHVAALFRMSSGHTKSCGCMKGAPKRHGMKSTTTYNTWCAMKARCSNPKNDQFKTYGGRGIRVCQRWQESFEAFLSDMGERPVGMTIERKSSNGDYEPSNCRWASEHEQARNRRSTLMIERNCRTMCVKDWCDALGLPVDRVYSRIRRGEEPAKALR